MHQFSMFRFEKEEGGLGNFELLNPAANFSRVFSVLVFENFLQLLFFPTYDFRIKIEKIKNGEQETDERSRERDKTDCDDHVRKVHWVARKLKRRLGDESSWRCIGRNRGLRILECLFCPYAEESSA